MQAELPPAAIAVREIAADLPEAGQKIPRSSLARGKPRPADLVWEQSRVQGPRVRLGASWARSWLISLKPPRVRLRLRLRRRKGGLPGHGWGGASVRGTTTS